MQLINDKLDAMTEVVNIGVGKAAASLSELIGDRIELHVPSLRIISVGEADRLYGGGISVVQGFGGSISGNALLVVPEESGQALAALLIGCGPSEEVQPYELSGILSEVGNILLNGVMGSIANVLESSLDYDVPCFYLDQKLSRSLGEAAGDDNKRQVLVADTSLCVSSRQIEGKVLIAFEVGSIETVLTSLDL